MRLLSLRESVGEFQKLMTRQLNLKVEASNLMRLRANFEEDGVSNVSFPRPVDGLVSENVLVETFQEGTLMSDLLEDGKGKFSNGDEWDLNAATRKQLSLIGLDAVLRMVFRHNFIHAD